MSWLAIFPYSVSEIQCVRETQSPSQVRRDLFQAPSSHFRPAAAAGDRAALHPQRFTHGFTLQSETRCRQDKRGGHPASGPPRACPAPKGHHLTSISVTCS